MKEGEDPEVQMPMNVLIPPHGKKLSALASLHGLCAVFFLVVLFLPAFVQAQEFSTKRYNTVYAEVMYADEDDLVRFTTDIGSYPSFWGVSARKNPTLTRNRVDGLVEAVMRLLDMRVSDLHFTILLYKRPEDMERAYRAHGMPGPAPAAFYAHNSRSISVSLKNVSDRILAHEIAHAVISAYFIPPPPTRVQEVLAQYVDLQLDGE